MTVVVPSGKTEGASFPTFLTPQLSEVVGLPKVTPEAVHLLLSAFTVLSAGADIVGFCGSLKLKDVGWETTTLLASVTSTV